MFRIDDPSAAAALPTPEAAGTEGYYTEGNPGGAIPATLVRASWLNGIQEELRAIVTAGGLTPTKTTYNQVLTALKSMFSAPSGSMSNAKMAVGTASASATLTADEIVVGTALGGQTFRLASFNKTVNLATTGAGGMDTGTAPVSGFVALYAIYNPTTQTAALLATNASTLQGRVYGGANMPAGYTASALVSVWPTDGTSKFKVGVQLDRQVSFTLATALNTGTSTGTVWTSLSLSSIVPLNARSIGGTLAPSNSSTSSVNTSLHVASDSNGSGEVYAVVALTSASGGGIVSPFAGLALPTAQTLWYESVVTAGTPTYIISVSSYAF